MAVHELSTLPGRAPSSCGPGAIFDCELKGGREAGVKLIEALRLLARRASVGDALSPVTHPASTTRQQMEAAGVSEAPVRLSIGLEDPEHHDPPHRDRHRSRDFPIFAYASLTSGFSIMTAPMQPVSERDAWTLPGGRLTASPVR